MKPKGKTDIITDIERINTCLFVFLRNEQFSVARDVFNRERSSVLTFLDETQDQMDDNSDSSSDQRYSWKMINYFVYGGITCHYPHT